MFIYGAPIFVKLKLKSRRKFKIMGSENEGRENMFRDKTDTPIKKVFFKGQIGVLGRQKVFIFRV